MFRPLRWMLLVSFCVLPSTLRAETKDYPFLKQVQKHFAEWDLDNNGELSAAELQRALLHFTTKGEAAAAVATLFAAERDKKDNGLPSLTLENLGKIVPLPKNPKELPDLQTSFDQNLATIKNKKHEFFTKDKVALSDLTQGQLGDCYLVSMVGWVVYRKPEVLKGMFAKGPNGTVDVTFPGGKKVQVNSLRDGELVFVSSSNDEGTWLNYIEKAVGANRNAADRKAAKADSKAEPKDKSKPGPPPFVNVGAGGSMDETIELFTDHRATRIDIPEKPAKRGPVLDDLRSRLTKAQRTDHMVGIGTPPTTKVPGLVPGHAYAVLHYNLKTNELTIWNPHGNDFKPTGSAGLENGYLTEKGTFRVPFDEAAQCFCCLVFETNDSVEKK